VLLLLLLLGAIMRILQDETPFIVPQSRSFSGLREFFGLKKRKPLTKILSENIRENPSLSEESTGTHLVDAFICEPIPYRTAIQENCTHIGNNLFPLPPASPFTLLLFISCSSNSSRSLLTCP
jgi:hypothetical protein